MDALKNKNPMQLQAEIRNNAEQMQNVLKDLYNWQKDMKEKEKDLQQQEDANNEKERLKTLPVVRSHVGEQAATTAHKVQKNATATNAKGTAANEGAKSPVEKCENPLSANEEKRKQANEIKDLGNKFVKLGNHEKAIAEYTKAIEIYPEDAIYYSNRALCYLKLERYDECLDDCDRAIDVDCLNVKAHYRRMQANECLGNNMDALKDCTTVLMIEPKNSEAQKSLDRINDRLKKTVKTPNGPNFTALRDNLIDILPYEKPPYKRSNQPLHRVTIADVVVPKQTNNGDNLKISDEDIDKLFNSNCGPFVEVKEPAIVETKTPTVSAAAKTTTKVTPPTTKTNTNNSVKESTKVTSNTTTGKSATNAKKTKSIADSNKIAPTKPKAAAASEQLLLPTNRPLPASPTSTAQFYSNWKELTSAQKYQYLKSIESSNLCKILGAGFDSETLTDIINIMRDYYVANKEPTTAATLLEVSKNNQVGILSLLMSTAERKVLSEIVNAIKENKSNATTAELIAKNFNLS